MKLPFVPRWFLAVCLLMFTLLASADSEQDLAREAVRAGEIVPLEQVLRQVEKISPGRVLKVELEQKGGIWVYKIKLLRDGGELSRLCFDARDGTLLENEPRRGRHGRRWGHGGPGGWESRGDD